MLAEIALADDVLWIDPLATKSSKRKRKKKENVSTNNY